MKIFIQSGPSTDNDRHKMHIGTDLPDLRVLEQGLIGVDHERKPFFLRPDSIDLDLIALDLYNLKKLMKDKWSPLRQEPEAPSNNATSRNCELAHA
jgi:hypothetical protein